MRKPLLKTVTALTTALLLLLLLPVVAHADDTDDVVMLTNGGRLRGVVIEEDPQKGVRIELPDGTFRSLKPTEVREVRYHAESPTQPAPAAPAPAPAPAP
ncbi:MAG TPA: hypothetical protein VHW01_19340, partial [Polyangiaceae bacterium]|nr:hypothetical protein [Polyangiaceae bacterium]